MLYSITATITRTTPEGTTTKGIPTFCLNSNVQGIVDAEHAEKIALDILNPFGDTTLKVMVTVTTTFSN